MIYLAPEIYGKNYAMIAKNCYDVKMNVCVTYTLNDIVHFFCVGRFKSGIIKPDSTTLQTFA